MSNPVKPSVKLKLAGVEYKLHYDFEAIAEAEEILDRPLITGLRGRDIATPKVSLVRAMFFATAHATHPELTPEQAKSLVTKDTLVEVWPKVLEAWALSQPDPEENADENPTQDQ
jgi:hypothetical protein